MTERRAAADPAPARPRDARGRVVASLREADAVVAVPHAPVDGDGLGSALGLVHALEDAGRRAAVVVPAAVPEKLRFLPGAEHVHESPAALDFEPGLVVALDGNTSDRFGAALPPDVPTLVVDHHRGGGDFGAPRWIDPAYAATGAMVYDLVRELGLPLGQAAAQCLYTALVTDTGRFSYPNTTPNVHRTAADLIEIGARPELVLEHVHRGLTRGQILLRGDVAQELRTASDGRVAWTHVSLEMCRRRGVVPSEARDLVELAASLRGVRLSALFREREDGVHVSLRSPGAVDVAEFATRHGGGGHRRAAGFRAAGTPEAVQAEFVPRLVRWERESRERGTP